MSPVARLHRPLVPEWLRPLARASGEVQFGVLPGGTIIAGVTPAEAGLLARLDGTLTLDDTVEAAAATGVSRRRWLQLVGLARRLGVLVDADRPVTPADGAPPRILVDGEGPVADAVDRALRDSGVATVTAGRSARDRAVAAPARAGIDLVVLVGDPVVDPRRGDLWWGRGTNHLPVALGRSRCTVGPLVTPVGPCLWCLDRHRADRDDAWPTVMSQVADDVTLTPRRPHARGERHAGLPAGLVQLVTGTVALYVARLAEGQPPPPGVSVDLGSPWPRMDHRRWTVHPSCPAHDGDAAQAGRGRRAASPGTPSRRSA